MGRRVGRRRQTRVTIRPATGSQSDSDDPTKTPDPINACQGPIGIAYTH